jgi:hypothetical protein
LAVHHKQHPDIFCNHGKLTIRLGIIVNLPVAARLLGLACQRLDAKKMTQLQNVFLLS